MQSRSLVLFAVILTAASALPAYGQDALSAKRFVESIYHLYEKGFPTDNWLANPEGPFGTLYLHSSLIALMNEDKKAVGTDMPVYADADEICDCQDMDGIWNLDIRARLPGKDRAVATASFWIFNPATKQTDARRTVQLALRKEQGQWRIYDICDSDQTKAPFCMRAAIRKEIEDYTHHPE